MSNAKPWHSKITGHGQVDPADLLAHPGNWRIHPEHQQAALRGVIADIGFIKSVTVNETTGHVLDGHLRVALALRDSIPLIDVEYVRLTPAEEAEALATLDPLAALAGTDAAKLDELLREISTDSPAVQQMLDDLATAAGIVPEENDKTMPDDLISEQWLIVVTCSDEAQQIDLLQRFHVEGLSCRALIS